MDSPMRGRPLAVAAVALVALVLSLIAPRPTGFEWYALVIGVVAAMAFRVQCLHYLEREDDQCCS